MYTLYSIKAWCIYINVVDFILLVQDSQVCSLFLRPVLKQACPYEKMRSHLFMNRGINISENASGLSCCRQNG